MKSASNSLKAVVLAIIIGTGPAVQAQSAAKVADSQPAGSLTGRVVNEAGQPLANVNVTCQTVGVNQRISRAMTDAEGLFKINGLPPAAYLVSAYLPSYISAPRTPNINQPAYHRLGDDVRIELIKGGVITGTVTRAKGEPVVGVNVSASLIRDSKGAPIRFRPAMGVSSTDDRGVYRIYGLQPGIYLVSAGGSTGFRGGYSMDPYDKDAPTYAPSSTRDTAAEVVVTAGSEAANIDIRYRRETGHIVSGTVTAASNSDQRPIEITLNATSHGTWQTVQSFYQQPRTPGFAFYGVADGTYDLVTQVYLPDGDWATSQRKRITVLGEDVTGINLAVRPLASISGRVVFEDLKVAECEGKRRPLFSETVVGAWHNEKTASKDEPPFVWNLGAPTAPDDEGNFTLRNLAPGQYRISTRPMAKYWYLKSIAWSGATAGSPKVNSTRPANAASQWTTLGSNDRASGLTITIAAGAGSLAGQVDLGDAQKIPARLFVYLAPAERQHGSDVLRYFVSALATDGSFTFGNLPPGRYWLMPQSASEEDSSIMSRLRLPDESEMRSKILRDAEAANTEIEIKPCQNVTNFKLPLK
jgi:protocatechuate 3,4-dioxygenase beta subunit